MESKTKIFPEFLSTKQQELKHENFSWDRAVLQRSCYTCFTQAQKIAIFEILNDVYVRRYAWPHGQVAYTCLNFAEIRKQKEREGDSLVLLQIRDLILGYLLGLMDLDKYIDYFL